MTSEERERFRLAIPEALRSGSDRQNRTLVLLIFYTGCRISEALGVRIKDIDYEQGGVVFRTLKRRQAHFRFVPLRPTLLTRLDDAHQLRDVRSATSAEELIWNFGRTTAWKAVGRVGSGSEA